MAASNHGKALQESREQSGLFSQHVPRRERAVRVAPSGCQSAALHHDGKLAWEVGDDNGSSQAVEISLRAT